jgi:hypothetical protein
MRYTCALDVVDEYPDGITERGVGLVLGVGERAGRTDIARAGEKLRAELAELADEVDAGGRVGRRGLKPAPRRSGQAATFLQRSGSISTRPAFGSGAHTGHRENRSASDGEAAVSVPATHSCMRCCHSSNGFRVYTTNEMWA